jgi:PilZ domain-containing protein
MRMLGKVIGIPMSSTSLPPDAGGSDRSDRRRERRYEVELHGELRFDNAAFAVQIADMSGSGALVFLEGPPPAGSQAELWIEDFGTLPVEIMHAGEHFCGVGIINPAAYRDRLMEWLREEVEAGGAAAAVR